VSFEDEESDPCTLGGSEEEEEEEEEEELAVASENWFIPSRSSPRTTDLST